MFIPLHLVHLRSGKRIRAPGTAVQSPEGAHPVSLSSDLQGGPLFVTNTFCLGHRLFRETFWAVLAEVSNATTAEAPRPSADLLDKTGVCELELWLKFRSLVRTASSSSIGHDSSVVLLNVSKFVIRESISPRSTSDTDCSSRGIKGSSQSSTT